MNDDSFVRELMEARPLESWDPAPGDTLLGTLVEHYEEQSENGVYPVLIVRQDDGGEFEFRAWHQSAKKQLSRLNLDEVGRIGIRYDGAREVRGNSRYQYVIKAEQKQAEKK